MTQDENEVEVMVSEHVLLRADQFDKVERIAIDTGRDRSEVIRLLLDLGLVQMGEADEAPE